MPIQEPEKPVDGWGDGTKLPEAKPPDWSHLPAPPGVCHNTPCDLSIYNAGKTGEVIKEE